MSDWAYSTEGFGRSSHRIDGVDTVVYEIGAGEPLVYFHGGGTYHGFEWARDLADKFRVILPYHPNFGESGDADFTSLDDYVIHYEMLFAALELEEFHLMGASMGGHMAARYAAGHREEVRRLVLVSPAGLKSEAATLPNFAEVSHADTPRLLVADPAWLAPYWPAEPDTEWAALREREMKAAFATREDPAESHRRLHLEMRGYEGAVLLLWGSDDRIVPTDFIPEWQKLLPGVEVIVIPGGGHLLLDEFPEARRAAKQFLGG